MTYQDLTGERRREPHFDSPGRPDGPPPRPPAGDGRSGSRWRGKLLGVLVAVSAIAGFAGIAWYAIKQGKKNPAAIVPIIQADNSPVKVLPEQPGGMKVPNQDKLIYLQISPDGKKTVKEKMLPGAEKPMPKPKPPKPEQAAKATAEGDAKPKPVVPAPLQPPRMEAPAGAKPGGADAAKARAAAEEKAGEAKGKALDRDALAAKMEAVTKEAPKETRPAAPAKAQEGGEPETPAKPDTAAAGAAADAAKPETPPASPQIAATAADGRFHVQLGSSRLKDRAEAEAKRLNGLHASVLGEAKISAVRADLGERGIYYRLWAGPFGDRAAAETLCGKLKARKQGCLVLKR
jgi:cell division protein FtsN